MGKGAENTVGADEAAGDAPFEAGERHRPQRDEAGIGRDQRQPRREVTQEPFLERRRSHNLVEAAGDFFRAAKRRVRNDRRRVEQMRFPALQLLRILTVAWDSVTVFGLAFRGVAVGAV